MSASLNTQQINQFINDGYVRLENAFSPALAAEARAILWKDTGCDPNNSATWTRPVIRLGMYTQPPFIAAANTPVLHSAFDQVVGPGRWIPCQSMGTFPVRFPSPDDPGDTGWHVDASFPGVNPGNYFEWRINVGSKGRGLLMLFLFSDVGEADAPTRIRIGSHRDVARMLQPAGDAGLSFMELAGNVSTLPARGEVVATGSAGTVYLCHPFIVHAAQPHCGTEPRFLAQPPLLMREALILNRADKKYTPVEQAVRFALQE
jgi:hypothetical protein